MARALFTAAVGLCVLWGSLLMIVTSVQAAAVLLRGNKLKSGESLSEGSYKFIMQDDCQLALKKGSNAVWTAPYNTQGNTKCYCSMQEDGELTVYAESYNRPDEVLWTAGTKGKGGAYIIVDCSTGNLVMYSARGTQVWSTSKKVNEEAVEVTDLEQRNRLRPRKASKDSFIVQTVPEANE